MEQLNELGYYALAGNAEEPRACIGEVADAERMGIGVNFISERFNFKEAVTICGALGASSTISGVATGATNVNTRNPMVTASFCTTMNRLTEGRFALGLAGGVAPVMNAWGLKANTMKRSTDYVDIIRRLMRGETITDHDGPAGKFPKLKLMSDSVDDEVPILGVGIGEKIIDWSATLMDGIVLHTFFSDETLTRVVKSARQSAEQAGRDPDKLRIWSVLSIINENLTHDQQLLKVVGRMATYLQFYGDILVKTNRWDPEVLAKFKQDEVVVKYGLLLDDHSTEQWVLEHIAGLIPDEWLAASAKGNASQIAKRMVDQFDCGADGVIMHGVEPNELENVLPEYRAIRPSASFIGRSANPGK